MGKLRFDDDEFEIKSGEVKKYRDSDRRERDPKRFKRNKRDQERKWKQESRYGSF